MNLKDFVKDKDFSTENNTEPFPEGKTILQVESIDVQEQAVEFDGKKRMRYILSVGDKQYWAGSQIMEGVKAAINAGFKKVEVNRKGLGLKTKYAVLGVQE